MCLQPTTCSCQLRPQPPTPPPAPLPAQYIAMLKVLDRVLPELRVLLLDINCQFSKHLKKHFPETEEVGCPVLMC